MKKLGKLICITVVIFVFVLFSGCGVYDSMDLEKAYNELAKLKTTTVDLETIQETLAKESSYFGILEDGKIEDLKINLEYVAKKDGKPIAIIKQEKGEINSLPMTSYMILKPAEDKKGLLKEQVEVYYQNLLKEYSEKEDATEEMKEHLSDVMIKEYEGYLICILSNNNEEVWKLIEESAHSLLFQNTKQITEKELETEFSVKSKDIKEFLAVIPTENHSASFYIIVRPENGKMDDVKKVLNQYMKSLDKKWSTYLPDEYKLVKNHMDTEVGSYLVYIVSKDNQLVLNTIKNAVVKKD